MNCPLCNTPLRPGASFCQKCGTSVKEERCPKCNTLLVSGDTFCSNCGMPVQHVTHTPSAAPGRPFIQYAATPQQNASAMNTANFSGNLSTVASQQGSNMPPGFAAQQGPVGPTEGIPGRQYKQKSREIYGFLALVPPLLWTNFGIHDLYACRYKQAFIHMGLNASTWFLFYRLKEAEKRLDSLWIFASSSDINDRDTIVFLFVASALISIVWRFIECFTVKVDGRGVPMKNGKSIFSGLKKSK